jgi:hypothetical protein
MKPLDTTEIVRSLRTILEPGQVTEVRALEATTAGYGRPRTISGYFNDPEQIAKALNVLTGAKGIYFTPNPINPALLARACNRLKDAGKSETTSDRDIIRRRWLLVDCDPVRPAGISADEWEHDAAIDRACCIRSELCRQHWPEPIIADSGNGGHLLYRVDLAPDDGGKIERCLKSIAAQHSDKIVTVDLTVFNPARIWKLYGTWACKGDDVPQRPHRSAKIIEAPAVMEVVQ